MADFGLIESFNIDDGELDGMSPQECFVLGYELADISRRADLEPSEFSCLVHADNKERIEAALRKRCRGFGLTWSTDDRSETWMELVVAPQ